MDEDIVSVDEVEKNIRVQAGAEIVEASITVKDTDLAKGMEQHAGTYPISREMFIGELQPKLMMTAQILLVMLERYMGGLEIGYNKIDQFNKDGYITIENVGDFFDNQNKVISGHNKIVDTLLKIQKVTTTAYENFQEGEYKRTMQMEGIIDKLVAVIYKIIMSELSPDAKDVYKAQVQVILGEMKRGA